MDTVQETGSIGQTPAFRAGLLAVLVIGPIFLLSTMYASLGEANTSGIDTSAGLTPTGSTITVTTTSDELSNDGDCSLREAIQAANTDSAVDVCPAGSGPDTVVVPAGTYLLTTWSDLDVLDDLTLSGHDRSNTFIDGNARHRVLDIHGVVVTVSDLTVTNGAVYGDWGGGIRNGGTLFLRDSNVMSNVADYEMIPRFPPIPGYGAGISNHGTATVINSLFNGNLADEEGGAILNDYGGTITVSHSIFTNNRAGNGGGLNNNGTATVISTTFSDNYADSGGGISNHGPATVISTTFTGNTAWWGGGGISTGYDTLTVIGSTIDRNHAQTGSGGGILITGGTLSLENSTISGNVVEGNSLYPRYGGGIFSGGSGPTTNLGHVTIAFNSASSSRGGSGLYNAAGSTIIIHHTIVASNNGGDCFNETAGTWMTPYLNLNGDGSCPGFDTGPALLAALADNGGPTGTHLPGSLNIIDAGDSAGCLATDQRGMPRPQDGDGDGIAHCDLGAVEVPPPLPLAAVELAGPTVGDVCVDTVFTAAVTPISATWPIAFTWQATDQEPLTNVGGLADTSTLLWGAPGSMILTATAANFSNAVTATHTIMIRPAAGDLPIARLVAANDGPTPVLFTTTLTATYVCGTNATLTWDLGDGATDTGAVVSHTYGAPGAYTATVTASNDAGTATAETTVVVLPRLVHLPVFLVPWPP